MTFPDDIMRAAREAFIAAAPQMDRASAERIRAGAMDDSHATTIIATAILAERKRCAAVLWNDDNGALCPVMGWAEFSGLVGLPSDAEPTT